MFMYVCVCVSEVTCTFECMEPEVNLRCCFSGAICFVFLNKSFAVLELPAEAGLTG